VKPRLVKILGTQMWQQGDAEKLKNLGFGETSQCREIYFSEMQILLMLHLILIICFTASSCLEVRQH